MSGAYLAMSTSLQTLDDATLFAHACLIVVSRRHTSHMRLRAVRAGGVGGGHTASTHHSVRGALGVCGASRATQATRLSNLS